MKYALATLSFAALLLAGCGSQAAAPAHITPAAPQSNSVLTVGFDDNGVVGNFTGPTGGIRLTGESSFNSPTYGTVLGYFKGTTSFTSQVVTVKHGISIRFKNVDSSLPHTLSFLGKASKTGAPWPQTFTGSGQKSPAGTAIGTKNFSTGTLTPGQISATYTTGLPGFYMVGCAFHYVSHGMRTVYIVQ